MMCDARKLSSMVYHLCTKTLVCKNIHFNCCLWGIFHMILDLTRRVYSMLHFICDIRCCMATLHPQH